jgi:hypothetical protein
MEDIDDPKTIDVDVSTNQTATARSSATGM